MSESSTPPGHAKLAVPHAILWGWLSSAVAMLLAALWFLLHLSFTIDHRIIDADNKAGDGISEAKRAHDLAAHDESRIDSLDTRMREVERYCLPRKP